MEGITSPREGHGTTYYAHTMPGLARIAWSEIRARCRGASFEGFAKVPGKNGLVLFGYDGEPGDLVALRTTEDVFYLVERMHLFAWGYEGLTRIYRALVKSQSTHRGLTLHGKLAGQRHGKRLAFRVIARVSGGYLGFRRVHLEQIVERALERHSHHNWYAVPSGEDVEIWVNLIGLDFICGLRLSDASMHHRDYKVAHLPASLRPSVAAAMVWLTHPRPDDVFLDPMCGVGTTLIERGMMERHALLLGGDREDSALRSAIQNIGSKHKPRQIFQWDAQCLPLASNSVDKVVTNLPFGRKSGSPETNPPLYRHFFQELSRVLKPQGRAVILSGDEESVQDLVREIRELRIAREYPVRLLGLRAIVSVIKKRSK